MEVEPIDYLLRFLRISYLLLYTSISTNNDMILISSTLTAKAKTNG